ncbi:vesicle transport v-SNARE 13-like [Teleopsis dalmanni]|uniref:vesicle transport v-SNARE 13-like n=1 Tax=Teleopsis dalmanni TaxID=139649 RepID=UPI0018CEDFB0|nr:vesicle transport v-SNARE 13-like [Teleopsis dalmanni]XP_037944317.1 vesicle transport v-SNARE 13-like [Teleopsis dalmanni]
MSYWQNVPAQHDNQAIQQQEQLIENTYDVLERTSASLQRSNQFAIESEELGTEVLSELSEQRESLLRSTRRLQNANDDLSKSRAIIRRIRRQFVINKIYLILIIIIEIAILIGLILIKLHVFK